MLKRLVSSLLLFHEDDTALIFVEFVLVLKAFACSAATMSQRRFLVILFRGLLFNVLASDVYLPHKIQLILITEASLFQAFILNVLIKLTFKIGSPAHLITKVVGLSGTYLFLF